MNSPSNSNSPFLGNRCSCLNNFNLKCNVFTLNIFLICAYIIILCHKLLKTINLVMLDKVKENYIPTAVYICILFKLNKIIK